MPESDRISPEKACFFNPGGRKCTCGKRRDRAIDDAAGDVTALATLAVRYPEVMDALFQLVGPERFPSLRPTGYPRSCWCSGSPHAPGWHSRPRGRRRRQRAASVCDPWPGCRTPCFRPGGFLRIEAPGDDREVVAHAGMSIRSASPPQKGHGFRFVIGQSYPQIETNVGSVQLSRLARRSNRRSHRRNSRGIRPRPSQGPDHQPADRGA